MDMALAAKTLAESRHHRISSGEVYAALDPRMIIQPPPPSTTPTLRDWIERWLTLKIDVAASTHAEYARLLRHRVIADLGDIPVDQISRFDHLDPWKAGLAKDLAAASVHKHWAVLSLVMRDVVPHYRADNPLDRPLGQRGNGLPRLTPYRAYFLTTEEAQILLDACPEQIHPLIRAALGTGMRLGELLGLRVGSVHLDGPLPTVRVEQTLQGDGSFAEPKTQASRRSVTLTGSLTELFAGLIHRRRRSDLVFAAPRHGPWNAHNLRQRFWYPAISAAQRCPEHPPAPSSPRAARTAASTCDCPTYLYQRPRFHDLRHSHVAFLIDADWDFYAIQRRLGHASIKTTFDIYGHLLGYGDEQHLSKLELRLPTAPLRDERRSRPADP
ncbi:site-specific integrase [Actinoplanes sp. LDG1-01]|uniref:Site-specific integrase n=2 Tax=Paractinoplanes lichenicola TaxID=2802976 RepID=A0ABS1W4H5_9ACTN|nr:site-specific integrase [Actinoplanes lichenicola]